MTPRSKPATISAPVDARVAADIDAALSIIFTDFAAHANSRGLVLGYVKKIAAYTTTVNDYTVECDGTFVVTLGPTVKGTIQVVKNSGAGTVTVRAHSSVGGSTDELPSGSMGTYQFTGSAWIILE